MWTGIFVAPLLLGTIFLASLPQEVTSSKILAVAFISSKSHKITYERLLHELGARGHEVTVLTPIVSSKKVKNVREILTVDAEELAEKDSKNMPNFFEMKEQGGIMSPTLMVEMFSKYCKISYDLPHVKELLKEKFDLVMMPAIFNECTSGYVYKFNTSIILISPISASGWMVRYTGGSSPPSFVPNIFTGYSDRMTFYQRTINFYAEVVVGLIHSYYFSPTFEAIYREKLGDQSIPSAFDILKNTSIVLSNGHFTFGSPKPFLPDIIEVAGMHCRPAEPLPKDLEDFIKGAGNDGFIYFSMGSAIRGSTLPDAKRKMFLTAFSKLKQRVLWKWETETMPDLPPNVKLSKWLPQQDLLGHPKLKLFMTHGGFGSTTEAVYHGAPLVGIPMFGDQDLNMELAENKGFALRLDFAQLTEEKLLEALNEVIKEPKFKQNANSLSQIFRDQPDKALDRAVFWTEYVLRHKGAVHLRSAARELNFVQYYSLDVICLLLTTIFGTLFLIFAVIRAIFRKICGTKAKTNVSKTKKKN